MCLDWSAPEIQALVEDYREKRSIFTLEQLRRKIYELTGVVVAIATLSDKVQKKAYDVSQDKHENEQHIYKNTPKNRNVRIVIVEVCH